MPRIGGWLFLIYGRGKKFGTMAWWCEKEERRVGLAVLAILGRPVCLYQTFWLVYKLTRVNLLFDEHLWIFWSILRIFRGQSWKLHFKANFLSLEAAKDVQASLNKFSTSPRVSDILTTPTGFPGKKFFVSETCQRTQVVCSQNFLRTLKWVPTWHLPPGVRIPTAQYYCHPRFHRWKSRRSMAPALNM